MPNVARALCGSPYHKGSRWLLAMEFYRHPKHKTGLQSYCKTCTRISMRAHNLSKSALEKRYEYSREYKASKRREAGVPVREVRNPTPGYGVGRVLRSSIRVDPKSFFEWIDRFNIIVPDGTDLRAINRVKSGGQKRLSLVVVDRVMSANGAHDQVSVLYPHEEGHVSTPYDDHRATI